MGSPQRQSTMQLLVNKLEKSILDGDGPEPGVIDVSNRTQEQIAAIINDISYDTSSDDFMWIGNIVVA